MQPGAGDGATETPLSPDHTIKRLDFDSILMAASAATIPSMRSQALQLRREFERCRNSVPDPTELIESLKGAVAEHASIDMPKLWEKYFLMKKEFLLVEAETLFLESCLKPEGEPDPENVTEIELQTLEKQVADLRSTSREETEEIKSLIGVFTAEMEAFPRVLDSALTHFDECDKKMQVTETPEAETAAVEDNTEETSLLCADTDEDLERKARELMFLTGNTEIEILELDAKISKQEEYYKRIQNLHNTHNKLDLLSKILSSFSDWTVVGYENDVAIFAFKGSVSKQKKAIQNKHMKPVKEMEYKLHLKVHPQTLAVDNVQLEPKSEVPMDNILKEMSFRRVMHSSEVLAEPPNDLEFLLRKVGQWITSSRKPGA